MQNPGLLGKEQLGKDMLSYKNLINEIEGNPGANAVWLVFKEPRQLALTNFVKPDFSVLSGLYDGFPGRIQDSCKHANGIEIVISDKKTDVRVHSSGSGTYVEFAMKILTDKELKNVSMAALIMDGKSGKEIEKREILKNKNIIKQYGSGAPVGIQLDTEYESVKMKIMMNYTVNGEIRQMEQSIDFSGKEGGNLLDGKLFIPVKDEKELSGVVTMFVPKTAKPPELDGKINDGEWKGAAQSGRFILLGLDNAAMEQAEAFITRDDKNLYVAFRCHESQMGRISAKIKTKNGKIFTDDCIEFYIGFGQEPESYHQFMVNSVGTQYDSGGAGGDWKAAVFAGSDAWSVEMAIPFACLGVKPVERMVARANFCRSQIPRKELSAWPPVVSGFDDDRHYARIVFGPPPVSDKK